MARVTLRFYAELNDLLPPGRRQGDWECVFRRKWPPGPKESGHWF